MMYYAAAAATAAAAAAAEAAYNTAEIMSATAVSARREIQRLRGRNLQNDDTAPSSCWDEDKDDGWIAIMTPKLQRDADRQRSLSRALSLRPDQRFVCPICLDLLPFDDVFISNACVSECKKVCRDCAKDHVLSKLGDQIFPVTCPGGACVLSQQDVGGLLDEASMLRYLMLERYDYVRKNPRCVVCPCPSLDGNGCPGIVEMDEDAIIFVCPVCNHRRCVRCDVEAGVGTQHTSSCEMYQSWKRANESSDVAAEEYLGSDQANRVRCPRCRTAIERDSGCNHMRCVCGTHFCMVCRQTINGFHPYEHFHLRRNGRGCPLFPGV